MKAASGDILGLYLSILPPDKLALITIIEMMRSVGSTGITDGMKAIKGMTNVGRAIEMEYQADTIRSVNGTDSKMWQNILDPETHKPKTKYITMTWSNIGRSLQSMGQAPANDAEVDWSRVWTPSWSTQAHVDIGGYLVHAAVQTAKVTRTAVHPKTKETV
jgi:DNA-directed RNA polymerase